MEGSAGWGRVERALRLSTPAEHHPTIKNQTWQEIGTKDRIPEFIARAKDKNDPFRLVGFGHRVYKTFDPRSLIMKQICDEVLEATGVG